MKFGSSCCCWLTLLLVGSSIISVSPDRSTTATTLFHNQQLKYPVKPHITRGTKTGLLSTVSNKLRSFEYNIFGSNTMSLKQAHMPQYQQQKLSQTKSILSLGPSTSRTRSKRKESSLTLSVPKKSSSVETNSIQRRSRIIDTNLYSANVASMTEAMVYHHYSAQNTTESYPKISFHTGSYPKDQYQKLLSRKRKQREVENEIDKCRQFVIGDETNKIFYSPDYPSKYPKNINCTKVIEAPVGQLIRLDFRDSFNIEDKEDCKFDYLEIRNGPYGFSKLIGRYCGENFPDEITSNERHLWLYFHSDESIEYDGFTAVYEFIDRPKETLSTELNCTIEKDGFEGYVNSTDTPEYVVSNVTKNKIPLDCMWIIKVKEGWKIQIKFLSFNLNKPNDCETNFVDIFGEHTNIPSRLKSFCGSTGDALSSTTNILHVRFFAEQVAINSSFSILYTAYREKGTASCADDEYDCEDATCIAADLKCNDQANCKFRWDEENCDPEKGEQNEHVNIIGAVFGLILGGMIVTFLVNCIRKIMRDQKIIREHIRQSKESKLNEMGRSSKQRSRDNVSGVLSPRQKHSQTSLQILDDVSQRYYREVVPISVQTSKTDSKDHSILRHHHDMVVQTSLCDDSSTPDCGVNPDVGMVGGSNVSDMGCQTRESLFQPLVRQKSITSSSPNPSTAAAIRFSTFGYDVPPPPVSVAGQKSGTLSRHGSTNNYPESIELEERLRTASHNSQQHYSHGHSHMYSGSGARDSGQAPAIRPPQEMCHHHHQHQQHLQKHQMQQQHQQQPLSNPGTMGSHQHSHHAPGTKTGGGGGKHHKLDETSKVFIDIRNSAPDVIIMTSH